MTEKYPNNRLVFREQGRFRKARAADFGIGGVCICGHLLLRVYTGDCNAAFRDPSQFRYRCYNCEPEPLEGK